MEEDLGHINLFDAYLNYELSEEDKIKFENQLKTDARFKQAFEDYQKLKNDIQLAYEYDAFKNKLNQAAIQGPKKKSILLQPKFYIPVSIAALVAIIVLTVNPFKFESGNMAMETKGEDNVYSPSAIAEETEYAMDSTAIDTEAYYKNLENEMYESVMHGNAVLIYGNDILITAIDIPKEIKQVQLKTFEKTLTGEVIYKNSKSGLSFIQIKNNPYPLAQNQLFELNSSEKPSDKNLKFIYYNENRMRMFQFLNETATLIDTLASENQYATNHIFNPENVGGAVLDQENKLVGIISNKKNNDKSVTYFISAHYIGIELDNLLKKHKEMKTTTENPTYINANDHSHSIGIDVVFAVYF